MSGILLILLIIWLVVKLLRLSNDKAGAIILATAFPNVTYLGLPVLEQTFGSWARSVAIQLDLFAASPLLFTIGIMVARHYGADKSDNKSVIFFLNTPPFWAAFIAVVLNLNYIPTPTWRDWAPTIQGLEKSTRYCMFLLT